LAHDWWGMTYEFDVYVFMFGVTLNELLVEHIGIKKKKKKKYPLINFSLSNWASCLKSSECSRQKVRRFDLVNFKKIKIMMTMDKLLTE
jgi:hypothetical protein